MEFWTALSKLSKPSVRAQGLRLINIAKDWECHRGAKVTDSNYNISSANWRIKGLTPNIVISISQQGSIKKGRTPGYAAIQHQRCLEKEEQPVLHAFRVVFAVSAVLYLRHVIKLAKLWLDLERESSFGQTWLVWWEKRVKILQAKMQKCFLIHFLKVI